MGREILSRAAYRAVEEKTRVAGSESITERAQQRHRQGEGLNELVDPSSYGVVRRSISRKDQEGNVFRLTVGTAMSIETRLDTTGSMGGNVDTAFEVLPETFDLLKVVPGAPLARYDVHMATASFGDIVDAYILGRSQFEMGAKIAEQMAMLVPERQGDDTAEDPQYGIFGGAYLVDAEINKLGLLGYDFTITDAPAHGNITAQNLVRVYGEEVFDKLVQNGHQIDRKKPPQMKQAIKDLLKRAHAFVLSVDGKYREYWEDFYGPERVITLPRTRMLPQIQAAIIGLTEGTLDLQNLESFLVEHGKVTPSEATTIKRAVAGIPIGAQAALPNFNKIPLEGAIFKEKTDLWPMADEEVLLESGDEEDEDDMWS